MMTQQRGLILIMKSSKNSEHFLSPPATHSPLPCHFQLTSVSHSVMSLCSSMVYSPPGSSVHRFLQARILKWVAIPFSRGSFQLRDQTWVSCIAGRFFNHLSHQGSLSSLRTKVNNLHRLETNLLRGHCRPAPTPSKKENPEWRIQASAFVEQQRAQDKRRKPQRQVRSWSYHSTDRVRKH